jgi:hypothetical protein
LKQCSAAANSKELPTNDAKAMQFLGGYSLDHDCLYRQGAVWAHFISSLATAGLNEVLLPCL